MVLWRLVEEWGVFLVFIDSWFVWLGLRCNV